jgi:NAD(P)-dependent dehydrogenase (short-subunit alcohol dehydrogenase family)
MEDWNDDFSGKVTLVTGGATGIGKAVALAFAMRGAKVTIADNSDRALDTVSLIHEAKGEATFFRTDVADAASVRDLVESSVERYGKVDIAFNNAGVLTPVLGLAEMNEDQFDRAISINLEGIFLCLKYEVQAMLKTGGGSIVNTASVTA